MQQQCARTTARAGSRVVAAGIVGVVIAAAAVVANGPMAMAASSTTYSDLSADFAAGSSSIVVGGPIDDTDSRAGTLSLTADAVLDLHGNDLAVQGIQLSGFGLTVLDSVGDGVLTVDHSGGGATAAAIEVDGGSLTITDATVVATASTATNGRAAAIGGGSGSVGGSIAIGGYADVTAIGSAAGAAIGDGSAASGASVTISGHAIVTAKATGSAAAIGGGSQPTGTAVGTPSITVTDYATVDAVSTGTGAAIGGGLNGGGGSIGIHRFANVCANGVRSTSGDCTSPAPGIEETGIGDGDGSDPGYTSSVLIDGNTVVGAFGGSVGGAAIGGARASYGDDTIDIGDFAKVLAQAANGPGIGGTKNRAGTTVGVSGTAEVTAIGGGNGAAIGGGDSYSTQFPSKGSQLTIGSGARVSVAAASGISAIGAGTGPASGFGSVQNSGTLLIARGSTFVVPANAAPSSDGLLDIEGSLTVATGGSLNSSGRVTNGGTITVGSGASLATSGTLANTGTITGAGTISNQGTITNASGATIGLTGSVDNQGTIVQNGTFSTTNVTGNNFQIIYDAQGGTASRSTERVYAPTFASAQIAVATSQPRTSGRFSGWTTADDGTGSTLDAASDLPTLAQSTSQNGTAVQLVVYAQYQLAPILPTSSTLPTGVYGSTYSTSLAATTGTAPIAYSRVSGDIPAGLTFNRATGVLSGTPSRVGTFTMTVQASNAYTVTHSYTIVIDPASIVVTAPSTPTGSSAYRAGSTVTVRIAGLQTNERYVVSIGGAQVLSGSAASTDAFSVPLTIPIGTGSGSQAVKVTGTGHSSAGSKSITVSAVAAPTLAAATAVPAGTVGTTYEASIAATGTAPIAYSISAGSLPAGLSLAPATGRITGTPVAATSSTFTVSAANGYTASKSYTIVIAPAPLVLSIPSTPTAGVRYLGGTSALATVGGLQKGESYSLRIGSSTITSGSATTGSSFTVPFVFPRSVTDTSTTITLSATTHGTATRSVSVLTAAAVKSLGMKLTPAKTKAKKKLTITLSKLYAGEKVTIIITGPHKQSVTAHATSKGGYVLTLKKGLAKGKYKVTVTGAGTSRKASTSLTVS